MNDKPAACTCIKKHVFGKGYQKPQVVNPHCPVHGIKDKNRRKPMQKGKMNREDAQKDARYDRQEMRVEWLAVQLARHVAEKDRQYGSSWRKRGGPGAFFTIVRKWDRIDEALEHPKFPGMDRYDMFKLFEMDARSEGILDDWLDLLGYGLVLIEHMVEMGYVDEVFGLKVPGKSETTDRDPPLAGGTRAGPPRVAEPHGYDPEQDDPIEGEGPGGPAR